MFEQTNFSTLFLTCTHLEGVLENFKKGDAGKIKNLVIMDSDELDWCSVKYAPVMKELETLQLNKMLKVYHLKDILASGQENLVNAPKLSPNTLFSLSYTSGTTGLPKGAMLTHGNMVSLCTNDTNPVGVMNFDHITGEKYGLSYCPLAHVMERMGYIASFYRRTAIGVFSGDIMKIREDICILKPCAFGSVPRLFNRIADLIKDKFNKTTGLMGYIIRWAVETKLKNLEKNGTFTHWFFDRLIFNKVKALLGGEVLCMGTGSAPMGKDVMAFLRIAFCVPVTEGYGQTEACGMEFIQDLEDTANVGYVGGILSHLEFKLIDVPEMKYFANNLSEDGKPYPQGEILVRGTAIVPGYYKCREIYDKTVDKDGWLHSGDIGELGPDRSLKIIDRAKNIFKLAQGEYIAPDRLAEIYKSSRFVTDILVYGNSLKATLIAMIHPDPNNLKELAEKNQISFTGEGIDNICENEKIKT